MAHFDQDDAECLVFTYKEGLLSPIAHDLKIRVTRFGLDVDRDAGTVRGELDMGSLRVVAAMKDGREAPSALSDRDKREIESNIRKSVLHPDRHPTARFEATRLERTGEAWTVEGDLTLHGVTRRISTRVRPEGDALVAEVVLHQPDFGVKPYRAALGTLKVQPDVRVRISVPAADLTR